MAPRQPRTLWDRIRQAVRNDPQKAGILTVLVSILVVLQIRLQMSADSASPARAAANVAAPLADNPPPFGAITPEAHAAARPLDSAAALRAWMDAPAPPLTRNLFDVDLDRFPHDGSRVQTTNKAVVGFWDELAKSLVSRADVKKERQILVENLA